MKPPRQKSMAMRGPTMKGMDTAEGRGTHFLYASGTTKSLSCGPVRLAA